MKKLIFLAISAVFLISSVSAAEVPTASPEDARIKTLRYDADDVIRLKAHTLISTFVRFAPYEKIENVAVGDSKLWWVVENANSNGIFIKPLRDNIFTNLVVTTTHRVYTFELTADKTDSASSEDLNFLVTFEYPDDEIAQFKEQQRKAAVHASPAPVDPEAWNFRYEFSGSKIIKPTQILDDGKFTYFDFGERSKLPAIFAVDPDGNEAVVNFHKDKAGRYVVVERIEHQFTLRDGKEVTCIFNVALGSLPKALSKNRREPL